jgi:hypothetical protein
MRTIYYVQTNDPRMAIQIPANEQDGEVSAVATYPQQHEYSLTNPFSRRIMDEARRAAQFFGLRLHQPGLVAVKHYD